MPAPMPLEPPVTRATLPLNDFVCIWPPKPPGHPLCHIMDCSVQNEHSAGAAHIRANGGKLIPMQPSPIADTSRLLFPSLRFASFLLRGVSLIYRLGSNVVEPVS